MPGVRNLLMLPGASTGGAFSVMYDELAPEAGPPPHMHAHEDEVFIVADGTFEFWIEGETTVASAGDVVFAPRGSKHTFKNVGSEPGHCWVIVNSATFDPFLKEFYAHMSQPEPDMGAAMAIGAKGGITFLPPGS